MRDGFVKVGAATPDILVADCVHNREEIVKKVKESEILIELKKLIMEDEENEGKISD